MSAPSNGNGNNGNESARKKAFNKFWERTGRKPFGPDFHDSMVNVMSASPRVACLTERVWAWQRWRSWCNSSEHAKSDWRDGSPALDQTDCALDIWWLKHGMTAEWVMGAPSELRKKERQRKEVQHFKPRVSIAFGKVITRGDIRFEDGKLVSVMSPRLLNSATEQPPLVAKYSNRFLSDKRFHAWRAVAKSSNHEGFMVAKSTWNQVLVVARSDYREWLELTTADTASLTDGVLIPPNAGNGAAPSGYIRKETEAAAAASVSEPEPPLPLDPLFEHIHGALERNHCAPDDSRVLAMADALRAVCPDVTGEEAEHFIDLKGIELRKRGNVRDWFISLKTYVPPMLQGNSFEIYRKRTRAAGKELEYVPPVDLPPEDPETLRQEALERMKLKMKAEAGGRR